MGGELRGLGRGLEGDDHRRVAGSRLKSRHDGIGVEELGVGSCVEGRSEVLGGALGRVGETGHGSGCR